jgi:hypothetical protein
MIHAGTREYLVEWVGYSSDEASWEPECNIMPETIEMFMDEMEDLGAEGDDDMDDDLDSPGGEGFPSPGVCGEDEGQGEEEVGEEEEDVMSEDDGAHLDETDGEWGRGGSRKRAVKGKRCNVNAKQVDGKKSLGDDQPRAKPKDLQQHEKRGTKEVAQAAVVEEKPAKREDKKRPKLQAEEQASEQSLGTMMAFACAHDMHVCTCLYVLVLVLVHAPPALADARTGPTVCILLVAQTIKRQQLSCVQGNTSLGKEELSKTSLSPHTRRTVRCLSATCNARTCCAKVFAP